MAWCWEKKPLQTAKQSNLIKMSYNLNAHQHLALGSDKSGWKIGKDVFNHSSQRQRLASQWQPKFCLPCPLLLWVLWADLASHFQPQRYRRDDVAITFNPKGTVVTTSSFFGLTLLTFNNATPLLDILPSQLPTQHTVTAPCCLASMVTNNIIKYLN
jgi:hypothetical protein